MFTRFKGSSRAKETSFDTCFFRVQCNEWSETGRQVVSSKSRVSAGYWFDNTFWIKKVVAVLRCRASEFFIFVPFP